MVHFKFAPLNLGVHIGPLANVIHFKFAPLPPSVYIGPLANVANLKFSPLNPSVYRGPLANVYHFKFAPSNPAVYKVQHERASNTLYQDKTGKGYKNCLLKVVPINPGVYRELLAMLLTLNGSRFCPSCQMP